MYIYIYIYIYICAHIYIYICLYQMMGALLEVPFRSCKRLCEVCSCLAQLGSTEWATQTPKKPPPCPTQGRPGNLEKTDKTSTTILQGGTPLGKFVGL